MRPKCFLGAGDLQKRNCNSCDTNEKVAQSISRLYNSCIVFFFVLNYDCCVFSVLF